MVNPHAPKEDRTFYTLGTGHPVPKYIGSFIGTYQMQNGNLVFHVFNSL